MPHQNIEDWHHLPSDRVIDILETNRTEGLHPLEVERRRQKYGANILTLKEGKSPLIVFLEQFNQPLIYILLASALITAILRDWIEMGVIFAVVFINAIIGFVQEIKAVEAMAALARAVQSEATVVRGGQKQTIAASEIVLGDIVLLKSGDKVPADLRLIESRDLKIAEAALTGESLPSDKEALEILPQATVLADRLNLAFATSLITYGTGVGAVVATGDNTQIGRINESIASVDVLDTPLTQQLDRFSQILLKVILAASAVASIAGAIRGYSLDENLLGTIALAVAAVPEGLPAAVTISLAIGVARMAKKNAIVRKLPAVETLGSTTIICSDKTGTLTQNEMTVREIFAGDTLFVVSGVGYAPEGEIAGAHHPSSHCALLECLKAGMLCNDSRLVAFDLGWKVEGDPTEAALLASAQKAGLERAFLEGIAPRLDTLPFESEHQCMATLHENPTEDTSVRIVYIKGSVEKLLPSCIDTLDEDGRFVPIDVDRIEERVDTMTAKGLRVLAFARVAVPIATHRLERETIADGLTFLGLQGATDPPRPEAIEAVKACQVAGIEVKMITGDRIGTAVAIGKKIGIIDPDRELEAISGGEIATLSDSELELTAKQTAVFARVSPDQKLRLVRALQSRGEVVAMTGDGVNDAPALRQADIGIAMGITGTEVAKESAAMILTDDNFATIEAAVEEGRGVYDNIVKFVVWALPTNLSQGLVVFISMLFGATLPILPLQILWINTTTVVLLGTGLAFEPKEPNIMHRPPRPPKSPLLDRAWVWRVVIAGAVLCALAFAIYELSLSRGDSLASARTSAVNAIVFGEIFLLLNCRSLDASMFALGIFSNPLLWLGIVVMVLLQLLFTYATFMQKIFGTSAIDGGAWIILLGIALVMYLSIELDKWLRRRRYQNAKP
jgi:cation-transporting P-type ATPase F